MQSIAADKNDALNSASDTKKLYVAIAAGGTAGHVNPALALAEELRARGHHVEFFGQQRRLEGRLVPEAGFDFFPIEVSGFDRSRPWTLVSSLAKLQSARRSIAKHFAEVGTPDCAVGFGAYVELPLLRWCKAHGVPYVLHEQNSVPGLANKTLAGGAARVCISFPAAQGVFESLVSSPARLVLTGNPVRKSVIQASYTSGRASAHVPADGKLLLVFGGSLGASHLNLAIANLKEQLLQDPKLYIVHSTGADGLEDALSALALTPQEQARWQVLPYISNMGDLLAAADLVVSRAGASSIAEIAASETPSLLVPYPHATADHQTTNAHYLVDAGAAELVADSALDTPEFSDKLMALLGSKDARERMHQALAGLGSAGAAQELASQVESVCS